MVVTSLKDTVDIFSVPPKWFFKIFPHEKKIKTFGIKELLGDWEKVLGNLAGEFRKGCATVTPRKNACTYCHLGSLCRIKEREHEKSNG